MKALTNKFALSVLSLSLLSPTISTAADSPNLKLVNHFTQPLTFVINRNADILPDFATQFVIGVGQDASSQVKDMQKEAYIRVQDDQKHSGFFGVDIRNGEAHIYGYLSKGIAYSWKNQTVTFCTPEEYKQKKSC